MWLLIPIGVLAALGLAAVTIGLLFAGLATLVGWVLHNLPVLFILVGAWLLLRSRAGWSVPARSTDRFPGAPPIHARAPRRPDSGRARPRAAEPSLHTGSTVPIRRRELPIDIRVKVEQIRHKADLLAGYADRFPPFSHDLHIVRRTAADYLPRTIDAYLALPGTDDPAIGSDGKTALSELRDQLSLLDARLDEIARDLQSQDVDRLLANRRFLDERFRPAS